MAEAVDAGGGSPPPGVTDPLPSDEYECKICYNYFDLDRHTPKVLGCSHTFCLECLDALHSREGRGWRIGCPVCRHRTPVPEYRIHNLPDNAALTLALPLKTNESVCSSNTDVQTCPAFPSAASPEISGGCQTCKKAAVAAGWVCGIFSFLSMVGLLFPGLIFVHNFNNTASPVGPVCLFVAGILAFFWLIITWLMCMLKYQPDPDTSRFPSPTFMI